jgi:hypothetical protein
MECSSAAGSARAACKLAQASKERDAARRARWLPHSFISISPRLIQPGNGMYLGETLTEYLERVFKLIDPRPCEHIYDLDPARLLRCVRCKQVHPEPSD